MNNKDEDENKYDYQFELFIITIIIICMIYIYKSKNTKKYLYKLIKEENKLKKEGMYGNIIFIIIGILLNGFFYAFINLSAGFIFGFKRGVILAYIIAIISSIISFYLSKYIFKQRFINFMKNYDRLKKIYKNQYNINTFQWFKINILLRITPIAFNITNYFLGATNINIFIYIISTMIGILPLLIFETFIGSTIKNIHNLIKR